MKVAVIVRGPVIPVYEVDADTDTRIEIDVDGMPLIGLDFSRTDGHVTVGHWPDGETWERMALVAIAHHE